MLFMFCFRQQTHTRTTINPLGNMTAPFTGLEQTAAGVDVPNVHSLQQSGAAVIKLSNTSQAFAKISIVATDRPKKCMT